jgi:hypothetical protein
MVDSRIHDLNYEWIEEDIIVEVFGIFQRRSLKDVGWVYFSVMPEHDDS